MPSYKNLGWYMWVPQKFVEIICMIYTPDPYQSIKKIHELILIISTNHL